VIPARKRWGQHFLARDETADRITAATGVGPEDTVIEVGPGEGALTRALLRRGARVLGIEIDPLRAEALRLELEGDSRARILRGDALQKTPGEWLDEAGWDGRAVLVANLPYNVATPVLTRAIEDGRVSRSVATIQREVARRLAARPGGDDYGYLSVRVAAWARARILFDLPPGAFRPRPRVVSSVVELAPREPPLETPLRSRALHLASLGFRTRRKTLPNALASAGARELWEGALAEIGRGPKTRAEELSLEDYLSLARLAP